MMRTFLLFVFALAFMGSTMAQKSALKAVPYGKTAHPYTVNTIDQPAPNPTVANQIQISHPKATKATLDTTWFGSSINIFGLLIAQQTCLWYDHGTDALMFTHRGNNSTVYPKLKYVTGNDLVNNYSLDHGATFIRKTGVADGTFHRYPQGVIATVAGNTDINNTYAVMSGPLTDGSGWIDTYKASIKYDGTNGDVQLDPTVTDELLRQGMTATEDGLVHFCGDGYMGDYTSSTLMIRNGVFNAGGTIDWTNVDISLDDLIARKTDNTLITFFGDAHMAWNNDGSVGYVMVRGSDNRPDDKPSWTPIIFKSIDGGATWNQLPYFDFSTLTEITDWILPIGSDDNVYKPMFTDFDITVDALNKPHIFTIVRGAASADIDSLTYIWTRKYGTTDFDVDNNFTEIWLDATDNWHAKHLDTCWTDDVTVAASWYTSSSGNQTWDHRLQASRSYDGSKVFGTWTDSDYIFWGTPKYNLNPDLFIIGHSIYSNYFTPIMNVTDQSDIWGISYFSFTSPISMKTGPETYEIPVTVEDITSTGLSADNPVYHIYVKGVEIDFPVGVAENQKSNTKVSACYPNPSDGTAYFDVTTDNNSNVNVTITNVAGQTVSSKNFGVVSKGTRKLAIDNSNLNSGVYFCSILVGDQKFTNKMIVK